MTKVIASKKRVKSFMPQDPKNRILKNTWEKVGNFHNPQLGNSNQKALQFA